MTRADEIANEFDSAAGSGGRRPRARHMPTPSADADAASQLLQSLVEHPPHGAPSTPEAVADAHAAADRDMSADANADAVDRDVVEPETDPETVAEAEEVIHVAEHESLPQIARAAAGTWLKAAGWTAGTSLRVSNQLRKLASDPASAQEVIDEVTKEVREVARDFLGITELDAEVQQMAPLLSSGLLKAGGSSPEALRAQGEELLRAAADVGFDESAHPAFARILTELAPDEARILRLLALEGAQPLVDIRAHNLIGNGSQLIAQSLNMLGAKAGLRQRERVPVYLANLVRLNLIVLSDEALDSLGEYQVLEAQPEVLATLRDTIRARTIRRSVLLTPLGQEFCEVCLPLALPALPPPGAGPRADPHPAGNRRRSA